MLAYLIDSKDTELMSDRLHQPMRPPILGWFIPRVTPYGAAPEHIKQEWIDVPLPFRRQLPESPELKIGHSVVRPAQLTVYEDGIVIYCFDAVKSLRLFERKDAAEWWEDNYLTGRPGALGARALIFSKDEGDILPDRLMGMLLPGIETFDQIEP